MTSDTNNWIRRTAKACGWALLLVPLLASTLYFGERLGLPPLVSLLGALLPWLALARYSGLKQAAGLVLGFSGVAAASYAWQAPSNERNWMPEFAQLTRFEIQGQQLHASKLRDFDWQSADTFRERWRSETFDLSQLSGLDLIVVPFDDSERAAHVMLSFGFADGRKLALSVEARREVGEDYSLLGGAARQFELIYLFGSERDLLGLRVLHRGDRVYSFPLRVEQSFARELLLELCRAANDLHQRPQFYATLRQNCATTLLGHVNRMRDEPLSPFLDTLFPARIGQVLHRLGYLDTELDWPATQENSRIDDKIRSRPHFAPLAPKP